MDDAVGSHLAAGGVATVAIYFPGFHHSVDNDMLWGERWMEWDNLMAGNTTPLEYDSLARQPLLHPHRGYYDIWDAHARTIHSQAREAAAAGFKAFMFYHYWFANGRTALTRPLEAALFQGGSSEPRRLGLSFFFSWANEAWEKRWNVKISERSPTAAPITLIEQVCCSCSKLKRSHTLCSSGHRGSRPLGSKLAKRRRPRPLGVL